MIHAGIVCMGAYLPGSILPEATAQRFATYLHDHTRLHPDYTASLQETGALPGTIEDNFQGWVSQPWYEAWLQKLPPKKRENPFGGAVERRRVPLDPDARRNSTVPHPMLASDAETIAGALALLDAPIPRDAIDLVITSSLVPDRHVPLNASLVQHKLKLDNAGAYNIDTCCSSFMTMFEVATALIRSGVKKNVLLVASSLDSLITDKSDYYSPNTGDAAVAALVSAVDEGDGYLASHATSHGNRHAAIVFKRRPPTLLRTTTQGPNHHQDFVTFNDLELCKELAVNAQSDVRQVVHGALDRAKLTVKDVDILITHQPVAWAANAWREDLEIAEDRFHQSFESYGNIACCSAPVNLFEAIRLGKVKAHDICVMVSPGVGENHIAVAHRISPLLIESMKTWR